MSGRTSKKARYKSIAMAREKVDERAREELARDNSKADLGNEVRYHIGATRISSYPLKCRKYNIGNFQR